MKNQSITDQLYHYLRAAKVAPQFIGGCVDAVRAVASGNRHFLNSVSNPSVKVHALGYVSSLTFRATLWSDNGKSQHVTVKYSGLHTRKTMHRATITAAKQGAAK